MEIDERSCYADVSKSSSVRNIIHRVVRGGTMVGQCSNERNVSSVYDVTTEVMYSIGVTFYNVVQG